MRILVLCCGSRGDVQPFVALGLALKRRGNDVMLAAHPPYKDLVVKNGLQFADIGTGGETALAEWPEGHALQHAGALKMAAASKAFLWRLLREWFEGALTAARSFLPEHIVLTTFPAWFGPSVCEAVKAPFCAVHLLPLCETSEFAPPLGFGDAQCWFGFMALMKWRVMTSMAWSLIYRDIINELRVKAGLQRTHSSPAHIYRERHIPTIHMYSHELVRRPHDWRAFEHVVGAAFLPEKDFVPPPALSPLEEFLKAGEPPVYVGFGSMLGTLTEERAGRLLRAAAAALAALAADGIRSVLHVASTGRPAELPEGTPALPAGVLVLREACPHSWLFPRCSLVVTHGGAGTTHAALAAGKPLVVIPNDYTATDQPFWAGCVERAGAGVSPCGFRGLGERGQPLERAVRRLLAEAGRPAWERAKGAAQGIHGEGDGAERAADLILGYAAEVAARAHT
eukprot:tig00000881_g5237.t1